MAGMNIFYYSLEVQTTKQTMEEDILNSSPTVMFRGTQQIYFMVSKLIIVKNTLELSIYRKLLN